MTVGSDELLPADERLNDALIQFTACIGEALDGICSYGLTIGESYVPFDPDEDEECDEDDVACEQAWVRVVSVTPKPGGTDGWGGDCGILLEAELEVGVLRCIEIPEKGEAPTTTTVMAAAMQSMSDMLDIHNAAMGCEVWEAINVGQWQPQGPLGGQYGGTWSFTVEVEADCSVYVPPPASEARAGLWTGHGPPGVIPGSADGDEYIDLDTGDLYELEV